MKAWIKENIGLKAWGIFGFTTIMSVWAWSRLGTDISNAYRLFPLLGLIAFGTMWGHYVVWALREWTGADAQKTAMYSKVTQWVVLVALIAHPVILITKLNADGLGTPPESYKAYVGEALVGYIFLGTVCLLAFLAYEFKKWLQKKEMVWKVVMVLNHLAMLGIVIHALKLGNSVKQAPLKYLFPLYGISLIGIYAYLASKKKLV
jgi:hypothetical protein